MKPLTKAEEQVMQVLWKLDKAYLREIVEAMPNPKPHQNTVATLLKILVEKEFVGITVMNRHHQYYSLVSKEDYSKRSIKQLVKGYFEGSAAKLVSQFVNDNKLTQQELEDLLFQIKSTKNSQS